MSSYSRSMSIPRPSSYHSDMDTSTIRVPGLPRFTTRSAEKREADISSSKYVLANQTGADPLHTAWYINEKGDKVWLKFDSSIPCTRFATTETRFYKPRLHKICPDPYADKKARGM
eukprot:TRINITY_DN8254_c0_g1_i4.p1 TRINITY_DN8254_c0_g1~~TRINITY_DN8254_c0_g1_i4.p1  ORF type:complete len:116 (-),score=22.96 TRINITY_DN8254_c0_g1_i4:73-420(-)